VGVRGARTRHADGKAQGNERASCSYDLRAT